MKPTKPFIFREPPKNTQQYVMWLMRIGRMLTTKLNRSLVEEFGVTFNQVRTLFYICYVQNQNAAPVTLSHLGEALMVSLPNVNGMINRLQKDGYLRKKRSSTDKREHYVELTAKALRLLKTLNDSWPPRDLQDLDACFTHLSKKQKAEFSKTLVKIAGYL